MKNLITVLALIIAFGCVPAKYNDEAQGEHLYTVKDSTLGAWTHADLLLGLEALVYDNTEILLILFNQERVFMVPNGINAYLIEEFKERYYRGNGGMYSDILIGTVEVKSLFSNDTLHYYIPTHSLSY